MNSKFGLITGTDQSELKEVPDNPGFLALPEAGTAFREMQKAAEKDGIDLKIASSYRDFQRQLTIWNAKYDGERPVLDWRNRPVDISRLTGVELVCAILFWSAISSPDGLTPIWRSSASSGRSPTMQKSR